MVWVLLDTNVIISALIIDGFPRQILKSAIDKRIRLITSPILLSELTDVLRKKFNFTPKMTGIIHKKLRKISQIIEPEIQITFCRDSSDNRVLEAAISGKCDFIVTGDKDLLVLKQFETTKIISPKEFIKELGS
ncbi:putative toxin-antitoxin system toxin component, PIN family [Candidatus Gottesmanbacteria bacterium RBG_16_43_7]|uniref:Putative toxin-antitoxin system toxin component, PIN family n=1 Tax=Candidatus Gottesmanbacteria bacterium RBG_16_43_7 TaxID=1798373 RepID=A0A1F5Z957_9BACT|nr:MAG: putative toxin-antitoxin system toxin component, PIN family [Candidatus Gottesmanbacteria bacterium RBG_16_43_7]